VVHHKIKLALLHRTSCLAHEGHVAFRVLPPAPLL
jgi:hypothetical protein